MRRALEYVKAFDGVVAQHAQEPRLTEGAQMNEGELSGRLGLAGWPAVAEEAIIARDCLLAAHVGSRLHVCHVSTAGSVEIVRQAKEKGWNVTAEACPHHLLLTDELAATYDPIFKVNPPLRTAADVEALRAGLADGTIDIVATDHAPHPHEDKDCEWAAAAFGMLGLETALSVVQETMVDPGPARLGRRRRAALLRPGPDRPGLRPRPADRGGCARPTWCSTTRRSAGSSTRPTRRRSRGTRRTPAASCPGGWSPRSCAAALPSSTESSADLEGPAMRSRPLLALAAASALLAGSALGGPAVAKVAPPGTTTDFGTVFMVNPVQSSRRPVAHRQEGLCHRGAAESSTSSCRCGTSTGPGYLRGDVGRRRVLDRHAGVSSTGDTFTTTAARTSSSR